MKNLILDQYNVCTFHVYVYFFTDSDSIGTALRISNAQLGMVFDLRCLLPDTGKPITWTKNGEPLQNDPTNRRTFRNGLWTIRFNPLRSSDAGYYTCRYADGSMSYSTAIRVIGGLGSGTLSISQLKTLINYS